MILARVLMSSSVDQLKRKLRQLKKLEFATRFKNLPVAGNRKLIWDAFFSTKTEADLSVKYPLNHLLKLDHQALKQVFEEYFYRIYFQNYQERGLTTADLYDPALLSLLGLPAYASAQELKSRFRELAKRYHPDCGGDSENWLRAFRPELYRSSPALEDKVASLRMGGGTFW